MDVKRSVLRPFVLAVDLAAFHSDFRRFFDAYEAVANGLEVDGAM